MIYSTVQKGIAVNLAGATVRVALGAQSRGVLRRLVVMQTAGANEGFSYSLFESRTACVPAPAANPPAAMPADRDLAKVFPTVVVATGNARAADALCFDLSHGFANQDGGPSNRQNELYLEIAAAGAGASKTFGVVMMVEKLVND